MEKSNRTTNTIYNTGSNFLVVILKYVFAFVSRTIFIKFLGETLLGVNELLINVLYVLSIAELGLSVAIGYSLYAPIAKNDNSKISQIMSLYKKAYRYIGIFVLLFGVIIYLCLPFLINETDLTQEVQIVYILYLVGTAMTYFLSYKDILITADQKFYKLTKINIFFQIVSFALEIFAIVVLNSYIFYVVFKFLALVLQRLIINVYIGRCYKEIDFNCKAKLDKKTKKEIKRSVKGLVLHKVGEYAVNGTDSIIISYFLNIVLVGIYSNYILLTKVAQNILTTFYDSVVPSLGNLIVEKDTTKTMGIFKKMDFLGFSLYGLLSVLFTCCANAFVRIWIGDEYLLPQVTVFLISSSFFLMGLRMSTYSVKSAAGIFKEDSWSPFLQAVVNLVISVILCQFIGLDGIVIGTIVSGFVPVFARIFYLYKLTFRTSPKEYLMKRFLVYIVFYIVVSGLSVGACNLVTTFSGALDVLVKMLIALTIYILLFIVVFRRCEEYRFLGEIVSGVRRKVTRKWKKKK